jgi:hypothetical protein
MIERHHYFKLRAEHATSEGRKEVARQIAAALRGLSGVLAVTVGVPADDEAEKAWDVAVTVRFASLDDVARYRADPDHRRFVDEFLAPRIEVKKIWNFALAADEPSRR